MVASKGKKLSDQRRRDIPIAVRIRSGTGLLLDSTSRGSELGPGDGERGG